MDTLAVLNGVGAGGLACLIVWAVLSPRVRDGVVIKSGLILMALGLGALSLQHLAGVTDSERISRALFMLLAGLMVVMVGVLWRRAHRPRLSRRASDWHDFDDSRRHA